jgi:glycosyltransferase involved in cell wall biosynthesis
VKDVNLSTYHDYFYKNNYEKALEIISFLHKKHPSFSLYNDKLKECEHKIKASVPRIQQKGEEPNNETTLSREQLTSLYQTKKKEGTQDVELLIALAKLDLIDKQFSDALHKAKLAIQEDKERREAYQIAEQAAIEEGLFAEANHYFLSQPTVKNPPQARERGTNTTLPTYFNVPPLIGAGNDYRHILERASLFKASQQAYTKKVSIIIPVYNRYQILANTLAALTHQTYPHSLMEIIVVDDGSSDAIFGVIEKYEQRLQLHYARQIDSGFRVAAARNMGLKLASGEAIVFLDADILPYPNDIASYMQVLHVTEQAALIGHRRYVDTSTINDDLILEDITIATNLADIVTNNDVSNYKDERGRSLDWRFPIYQETNFLMDDLWPFTKFAAGNVAFSKKLLKNSGYMDEDFEHWGCEDIEFGYRLYNSGAYFIPMMNIVSLHQEPLENASDQELQDGKSFRTKGHEITQEIFSRKCPAPVARQYFSGAVFENPKVSIYIPNFNAGHYLVEAVKSCLDQNYGDLEVCICDDGSTDNSLALLEKHFSNNPKVRWVQQDNAGIGQATNTAISLCRGLYIAQLDADDRLKPNAVRTCVEYLDRTPVDAVYTDCDYIDEEGNYIRDGWCSGNYSRDWMATGMIATHFRMFRKRLWSRTIGCNTSIKNAVDLDLWLKFYEKGHIEHIHQVLYSYRWHGQNTSIVHRKHQENNHLKVVEDSLKRMRLDRYWQVSSTQNPLNPREFKIFPRQEPYTIKPHQVLFLIPTCKRYNHKAEAVRQTWVRKLPDYGFRYFFIIGKPELEQAEVKADTLYVPCEDNYESLILKLFLAYEFLYRNLEFDYIYKIDDDCYPNLHKIVEEILPQLSGEQYLGGATHPKQAPMNNQWHYGKCSSDKFDTPYKHGIAPYDFAKGGYGYFLRRDILPILFELNGTIREEIMEGIYSPEDVRIAEILGMSSIYAQQLKHYECRKGDEDISESTTLVFDLQEISVYTQLNIVLN